MQLTFDPVFVRDVAFVGFGTKANDGVRGWSPIMMVMNRGPVIMSGPVVE